MSNSPESKNSITNPGAVPSSASVPAANPSQPVRATDPGNTIPAQPTAATASPAATSPAPAQPTPAVVPQPAAPATNPTATTTSSDASPTQFKTENIGNWAAQQEGYFAEQNRKAEEKRKKSEQTRKKVMPIVFIVGGLIAAALIIWGIVALVIALTSKPEPEIPVISGVTNEDISDYRDVLQDFFNQNGNNVNAVDDAVKDVLDSDEGREYANEIRMSQMAFLMSNNYYEEAAAIGEQIDPSSLDLEQRSMLYSLLAAIYANLNNFEKASEYNDLMYQTNLEIGGEGGA